MANFEQLTADEFDDVIAGSASSEAFKSRYIRFPPAGEDHCFVHRGPLAGSGHFQAPGYCTLVVGDLTVDGLIDLNNPEGFDEGGLFIVIGNVTCRVFSGHYGKATLIDGNLNASELVLNACEDSSLLVTGDLKTKLFHGRDIWAEVGGVADMEYADGYCLPIGYENAAKQAIRARRRTKSARVLDPAVLDDEDDLNIDEALQRLKQGQSILR